ncbi:MAG: hypothetical protein N3F10_02260 [Candidatus Bathyarchaeota archaeon]|nr:hypothetical protein [Candidatus Bathyarchaeota archaeon]
MWCLWLFHSDAADNRVSNRDNLYQRGAAAQKVFYRIFHRSTISSASITARHGKHI